MDNILDIQLQTRINSNTSFVIYRFPDETEITLTDFAGTEPFHFSFFDEPPFDFGFIVYPFDDSDDKGWWFKPLESQKIYYPLLNEFTETSKKECRNNTFNEKEYNDYSQCFNRVHQELIAEKVKKVILSRVINRMGNIQKHLANVFSIMCRENPNAFVYLLSTPETGIWIGASPELLIKKSGNDCVTVSLAGTKQSVASNTETWNLKEYEEQGFVTKYIDNILKRFGVREYEKTEPFIVRANSVSHLKTIYRFKANDLNSSFSQFVRELHPTPALGGEPKDVAINIIRSIEKHNRMFYGGFIGPINNKDFDIYVNIRCMKIGEERSSVFVGGGLTVRSELDDEWRETEHKAQTLLNIVDNI